MASKQKTESAGILQKVHRFISELPDIQSSPGIVVGLSGGQDSCALLHALALLRSKIGFQLKAAHLNHGIRGADADAEHLFAESFSHSLGVACVSARVDVPGRKRRLHKSMHEAARGARSQFLLQTADAAGFRYVALGHTEDDHIETVLMNIIRGTGIDGLRGIRPQSGRIIRPILKATRKETEEYCREHGIPYRSDPSNRCDLYLRSRVREELLPNLAAYYNPAIRDALLRLSILASEDGDALNELATDALESAVLRTDVESMEFDQGRLAGMKPSTARRVIRKAIEFVRGALTDVGFESVDRILKNANSGGRFGFTLAQAEVRAQGDAKVLRIEHVPPGCSPRPFEVRLAVPGYTDAPYFGGGFRVDRVTAPVSEVLQTDPNQCMFDSDSVSGILMARNRRAGDRIQPLGMPGTKKLQDIFVDRKVPRNRRDRIPVIADELGVLCVLGVVVSERARISPGAESVLRVRFEPGANVIEGVPSRSA